MVTPTTASIKALLDVGTYPANTIAAETIFDFLRPRKRYPSIEIEMSKPEGLSETKERTQRGYTFLIHVYFKQIGLGSDEIVNLRAIEDQIVVLLSAATLGDHKITNEIFDWTRAQVDKAHPYFYRSTLRLTVNRVESTTATPDGVLKFDLAASSVDNPPGADYTYTNVYDVEIAEGYRDIEEIVTSNALVPVRFPARFNGRFIANLHVKAADIGSTGDKINQLKTLRANGFKPEVVFIYTNKDSKSPNPVTITETFDVDIQEINRLYSHIDLVRYRIIGKLNKPSTITAT